MINETDYPSLGVSVKPFDPEDSCAKQLNFVWECKNFTKDELTLKLDFAVPGCVSSSSNKGDVLVVTFYDSRLFMDSLQRQVWPETKITKPIKR